MLKHFDHVTIVVRDVDPAIRFFEQLGFRVDKDVVISGEVFADYMGVPGIEAQHITLDLPGAPTRTEIQLLHYRNTEIAADPTIADLSRPGFNHICFAVDDLNAEVERLRAAGVIVRTNVLDFHQRKLVFLTGPEGVTIELSEWEPEVASAAE
jgi:catechol 2,3-dioxygenase-like lactoylglutathione lyase family enzyme